MRTTIKQQMAALKKAMANRRAILEVSKKAAKAFNATRFNSNTHIDLDVYLCAKDKQWLALNDAYSTLAAVALNESLKSSSTFS